LGLAGIAIVPAWVASRNSSRKTEAKNELKQLGVYMALYEGKYKSYASSTRALEEALRKEGTDTSKLFYCHRCGRRLTFFDEVAATGSVAPKPGATCTGSAADIRDGAPPDMPIAWHRCPLADEGDDMNVLFFQGRVDVFAIGSPIEQYLRELEESAAPPK
jgi:hypothetical protein